MIFDTLQNLGRYAQLTPNIGKAIQYILKTDLSRLSEGKHEIDGQHVFVLISNYQTKVAENCVTESHKKYIDIQIMISGSEKMGVAFLANQKITEPYHETKDCVFYTADLEYITVKQGSFAVFFPTDLHSPCHLIEKSEPVKKAVIKVEV